MARRDLRPPRPNLWADPGRHKYWRHRIDEARRKIVAIAFAELAAAGHPVPAQAVGDAMADAYNALHDEELAMFPDAHETLDELKERGVKLALITNGAAAPQRAKVVRFALEHRFDHIQIEGEHGFGKPEERAYTHAMEVLGVVPHETWMVGDNLEWEVVGPQRLGIHAIWHDGYGVGLPPGSPIKPDRIIRRHQRVAGLGGYFARFSPRSARQCSTAPPLASQVAESAANSALVGSLPEVSSQPRGSVDAEMIGAFRWWRTRRERVQRARRHGGRCWRSSNRIMRISAPAVYPRLL